MKRRLGLGLVMAMLLLAGGQAGYAASFAALSPIAVGQDGIVLTGDKIDREEAASDPKEHQGERKLRKGFGARIWGPYWGYGPSFGRRCNNCQAECSEDGEEDSARCKRCRIRCGE
jgi:hypothetical protein